jgi:hypothetical protein
MTPKQIAAITRKKIIKPDMFEIRGHAVEPQ